MQAALRPPDCRRALSARLVKNATGAVYSILVHCIKLPDRRWRGGLFVVPLTALPLPANNLPSTPFGGLTFYSQACIHAAQPADPSGRLLHAMRYSRLACSPRAASLRLRQNPAPPRGPWAFAFAPVHPRCSRRLGRYTVICALSQIWLRPWATVKSNSTRHTVGSESSADTVTSS